MSLQGAHSPQEVTRAEQQHGRAPILGHFPCDAAPRHHIVPFTLQLALGMGPIFIPTKVEEVE